MTNELKQFLDQVKAGMVQVRSGGSVGTLEYTTMVALDPFFPDFRACGGLTPSRSSGRCTCRGNPERKPSTSNSSQTLNVASQGAAVGGRHWAWGSSQATVDAHDESMEVFKDLQHDCPAVEFVGATADFTFDVRNGIFALH